MTIPSKKLPTGLEMPVFGLGTWEMGGRMTHDERNDDDADITAIKNAIEAGITHIDTAEKYADGYAETLVGKAIQGYERNKLFLVSKVGEDHLGYKDLLTSLQNSLTRMQTDYLDLYMIHGPSNTIPIEETMQALNEAKDKGLIKNIAVSNFTVARLEAAQAVSKHPIVAGQYHLNLIYREAERKGVLEYYQNHDAMFIAWRPLQKGIFSSEQPPIMQELTKKYNKTPSQIALNWLISQKNVVTLSKMRSPEHLLENLGAVDWIMDPFDVKKLTETYPDQQDVSDAVPLME